MSAPLGVSTTGFSDTHYQLVVLLPIGSRFDGDDGMVIHCRLKRYGRSMFARMWGRDAEAAAS